MRSMAFVVGVVAGIGITVSAAGAAADRLRGTDRGPDAESPGFEVLLPLQAERVTDIAVSSRGELVVAGLTFDRGFPVTRDAFDRTCEAGEGPRGCQDGFLLILDSSGTIRYASLLGGDGPERYVAVAPAADGAIWTLVDTSSTTITTRSNTSCNGRQPVLLRISPEPASVDNVVCVGGPEAVMSANDLALAPDGSVWVTATDCQGTAETVNAWQPLGTGGCDVYVARYRAGQARPLAATYLGGRHLDYPTALTTTADGDAVITGVTLSRDFPTVRPFQARHGGEAGPDEFNHDAFVVRLDASGRWVEYSTFVGGAGQDHGLALERNSDGDVVVAGSTSSGDFPTTGGAPRGTAVRNEEAFVVGLDPTGKLRFAALIGGDGTDQALSVSMQDDGSMVVVGQTSSQDLAAAGERAHGGSTELPWDLPFLARADPAGASVWTSTLIPVTTGSDARRDGWSPENRLEAVTSDGSNVYLAGKTRVWTHDALDWTARETGHYVKKWRE